MYRGKYHTQREGMCVAEGEGQQRGERGGGERGSIKVSYIHSSRWLEYLTMSSLLQAL